MVAAEHQTGKVVVEAQSNRAADAEEEDAAMMTRTVCVILLLPQTHAQHWNGCAKAFDAHVAIQFLNRYLLKHLLL